MKPAIEVLPLRNGVSRESPTHLEVMVRITPPDAPAALERPLLNLALVIDRSGSMNGEKLDYAKRAAVYAVENLHPEDRISVVTYDDQVEALVPSTLAQNKSSIIRQIRSIRCGGSTALHAGWFEGARQVSTYLDSERLNRVILLSDGLANVGERNPDAIATDVAGLKDHGVSTTAIGVGRDFNEDLMQAIATSGDGTFYFIESPDQLPSIFDTELQGLMTTRGTKVRLQLHSDHGSHIITLFNDFKTDSQGRLILPNLVSGMPVLLAGTLLVPPMKDASPVGELQLSWDDTGSSKRQTLTQTFTVPALPDVKLRSLHADPEVESYLAEMRATQAKEEAIRHLDRGDRAGMTHYLNKARQIIQRAPSTPRIQAELRELDYLQEAEQSQDDVITRKRMHDQVYRKKFSREPEGVKGGERSGLSASGTAAKRTRTERIVAVMGDITNEQVDAIVNPTNTGLFGTGGTDGAVHRAGGPELTRACRDIGRCEPGGAVFTDGYNLPARFVIHTVGPRWQGGNSNEAKLLASCYRNSLLLAKKLNVKTIAFPAIGTGTYGYPVDQAAGIALNEIKSFLAQNSSIQQVRIVCFDVKSLEAYQVALKATSAPVTGASS